MTMAMMPSASLLGKTGALMAYKAKREEDQRKKPRETQSRYFPVKVAALGDLGEGSQEKCRLRTHDMVTSLEVSRLLQVVIWNVCWPETWLIRKSL